MEKLPIKTKIAAWWMIVVFGGIGSYFFYAILIFDPFPLVRLSIEKYRLLYPLICFFLGLYVLKKKKWAWWSSVIIFFIASIVLTVPPWDLISLIITIIPLVLLLLDRKNFWKIAT